jgi:hypothetical protein
MFLLLRGSDSAIGQEAIGYQPTSTRSTAGGRQLLADSRERHADSRMPIAVVLRE